MWRADERDQGEDEDEEFEDEENGIQYTEADDGETYEVSCTEWLSEQSDR